MISYKVTENGVLINNLFYVKAINKDIIRICEREALSYKSYATDCSSSYPITVNEGSFLELVIGENKIKVDDDMNFVFYKNDTLLTKNTSKSIAKKIDDDISIKALEGHKISENNTLKFEIANVLEEHDSIYGLGDKTGFINKRGYLYECWNTDDPSTHTEFYKALYKSIPFFMCLKNTYAYGIFLDNTYKSRFDFTADNYYSFGACDGYINYYFFFGNDLKEIIANYTFLTGRVPMPQIWTLGYQQSRWSYASQDEVLNLAYNFKKNNIPIDVIHLDIDYMDEYAVFTTCNKKFPDFKMMVEKLKNMGIKIVTIIDPGVKVKDGYYVFEEGIKNNYFATLNNNVYHNTVWPGDSVFPSFTSEDVRNWWGDLVKFLIENGVSGIWNDMNEPASFNGPLPLDVTFKSDDGTILHKEAHNVYGHNMAVATYNGLVKHTKKRPFIITRACYSGTNKYSTVWTGDNQSIWAHLQMSIPQLCNLGMSGFSFAGADIGGFGADTTKELLARWIQVGVFSPLCRNHSALGTRQQEPWTFDFELTNIYRKFVNLRYELIPYFYDLFYEHQINGLPILRSLVLEYPTLETRNINDEFLVGENILVAPIVNQGATKRMVYLPKGNWVCYETKKLYHGDAYIIADAPLDVCPIYIKYNSIIPKYKIKQGIEVPNEITLEIYGNNSKYLHYQDNGLDFDYKDGKYNLISFSYQNQLNKEYLHKGYKEYDTINVNVINVLE